MASNDIELFQSFCRKYVNKQVKNHFSDITGNDDASLSRSTPREIIKRICLHKNDDSLTLTISRLLLWWVEAKGLFGEYIYGIPAINFHETVRFKPQIKLFWEEKLEDAKANGRRQLEARHTVRYRGNYETANDLADLATKIRSIFNNPSTHNFKKGRNKYSYRDKIKGYQFIITADSEDEARKVINALLEIQDDNPLTESLLTTSTKEKDWDKVETITVGGETFTKPVERKIGTVYFTHAELSVHGMVKDKTLVSNLSERIPIRFV